MKYQNINHSIACLLAVATSATTTVVAGCTTANPSHRPHPDAAVDGAVDGPSDAAPLCTANQPLRCEMSSLVRCNGDGTAELNEPCPLGCVEADLRCVDLVPSNGLIQYLSMSSSQPDLDLGASATINTDTGEVRAGGVSLTVFSNSMTQSAPPGIPAIRVFVVRSLTAKDVSVIGKSSLAITASNDIKINGLFTVSGYQGSSGAGAFNENACRGQAAPQGGGGGVGGGGFGSLGGAGGGGFGISGGSFYYPGGAGGASTGNALLEPLRGGCDGGGSLAYGGGAVQLVSRTQILVRGVIAANGTTGDSGGGAGGGILLEAPSVEVSGSVVANGGGGGSSGGGSFLCGLGQDGRTDATPASGSPFCNRGMPSLAFGAGGHGGAGTIAATDGDGGLVNYGGHGGGGYGRIRINTASGDFLTTGIVSPTPSKGTLVTR